MMACWMKCILHKNSSKFSFENRFRCQTKIVSERTGKGVLSCFQIEELKLKSINKQLFRLSVVYQITNYIIIRTFYLEIVHRGKREKNLAHVNFSQKTSKRELNVFVRNGSIFQCTEIYIYRQQNIDKFLVSEIPPVVTN